MPIALASLSKRTLFTLGGVTAAAAAIWYLNRRYDAHTSRLESESSGSCDSLVFEGVQQSEDKQHDISNREVNVEEIAVCPGYIPFLDGEEAFLVQEGGKFENGYCDAAHRDFTVSTSGGSALITKGDVLENVAHDGNRSRKELGNHKTVDRSDDNVLRNRDNTTEIYDDLVLSNELSADKDAEDDHSRYVKELLIDSDHYKFASCGREESEQQEANLTFQAMEICDASKAVKTKEKIGASQTSASCESCEASTVHETFDAAVPMKVSEDAVTEKRMVEVDGTEPPNGAVSPDEDSEGSQDSGRATGGLASSMSPAEEQSEHFEYLPLYEFEIPNTLVGLVIGVKGKTIRELCTRTNVKMIIRQHHTPNKLDTHQICAVEGQRENINKCLRMLRRRFPAARFPDLNLRPVLPPPFPEPYMADARIQQLLLPEGVRFSTMLVSVESTGQSAGHLYLQLTGDPSNVMLPQLQQLMDLLYGRASNIPDVAAPVGRGFLCVAPVLERWCRVVTQDYFPESDEVMVKFVDYGGMMKIPRSDLRQIRTDFISLPFQSVECALAHVEPADGAAAWSAEACDLMKDMTEPNRRLEGFLFGYHLDTSLPVTELYYQDDSNVVRRLDLVLLELGFAKPSDPLKVRPVLMPPQPMVPPRRPIVEILP